MNFKSPFFYVPVAIIVIMIVFIGWQFMPNSQSPAILHVMQGDVQADLGSGYAPATEGMELSQNARVKTAPGAQAYVVLYERVIVRLEENTEVTIAELSKDSQKVESNGTTWSKIAKLGGVESYTDQTPTIAATVRGTSFRLGSDLLVVNGTVHVETQGFSGDVYARQKIVNGTLQNLTPDDLAAIRNELQFELKALRDLRLREVHKDGAAMSVAHNVYHATDADIANFFIDIDEGKHSEDEIRKAAPAVTPSMEVVFAYDKEIKDTLAAIQAYS